MITVWAIIFASLRSDRISAKIWFLFIAADLQKIITPFTRENLYLSFLDTDSYFEWQEETAPELRKLILEQNGFEQFVANLNSFVARRGVLSKIQTPLETLKNTITNVIGETEETALTATLRLLKNF